VTEAPRSEEEMRNKIVAFCCENSALIAAAAARDTSMRETVEIVRVPCSGKVETGLVLKCLEGGAPGVLVLGCPIESCKYLKGSTRARTRIGTVKKILRDAGVDENRVHMDFLSSADSHKLPRIVSEMQARIAAPTRGNSSPPQALAAGPKRSGH
jgi:F420-non-reducing hydrogenase iron-sulfur subunit